MLLKPGCRAVLPTDPQRPDTAFFSIVSAKEAQERRAGFSPGKLTPSRHQSNRTSGSTSTATGRSLHFAVPFLSDVGREHRFYAVDRRLPRRDQDRLSRVEPATEATQDHPSAMLRALLACCLGSTAWALSCYDGQGGFMQADWSFCEALTPTILMNLG
eukprot:g32597.t1